MFCDFREFRKDHANGGNDPLRFLHRYKQRKGQEGEAANNTVKFKNNVAIIPICGII